MSIPVKWFTHSMTGAPTPGTAVNTIISILDACLINGFNVQPVDSLTYDSTTGKCTLTVGAGHGFEDYQVILVEGADQAEFNGEFRVTVVDATTLTFTPDTAPTVASATGTITAKAAPVGGWSKAFSGTDKAAYVSTDPLYSGYYLRVDDSIDTQAAVVEAFDTMTDVDTGTGKYASGYWRKSDGTRSMDEWALVGDSRGFYLMIGGGNGAARAILFFGDFDSFVAGDNYNHAMTFDTVASGGTMNANGCITEYGVLDGHMLARDLTAINTSRGFSPEGMAKQGIYPDGASGGIVAADGIMLFEDGSNSWRGRMPGARALLSPAHDVVHDLHYCVAGAVNYAAIDLEGWR